MTTPKTVQTPAVGVVVIGRNEGERLKRCLSSAVSADPASLVYVDSGSTDGSIRWAQGVGVEVVMLDLAQPFTAARARNAGLAHLLQRQPNLRWVQFVDGDCELEPHWMVKATHFLETRSDVAVVCGRLRERHPEVSIYNRLCDIEWNTPVGEARACGGIAAIRVDALREVGGFDETLIAGEEPELCVRLRAAGWCIWRLNAEMAWHDAAITRFGQWWRRTRRSGHAFAQGWAMHGAPPERHFARESARAFAWGLALPMLTLLTTTIHPAGAALALLYPLQMLRLGWLRARRREPAPWAQGFFLVLGHLPEGLGMASFWWRHLRGLSAKLIEYK